MRGLQWSKTKTASAEQAAEKVFLHVIPNEVRNLWVLESKEREISRQKARLGMTTL